MTFTPVVPFGGYAGWSFLARTVAAQKTAFARDPALQRDGAYFREKIGAINTAEKLVGDRRLLSVALAAYGLEGDINNKYFIRKVLEDGTLQTGALVNKLADKRYLEFSRAFGFGDYPIPNTVKSDFPDKILAAFEARKFEAAIGQQNGDMRLALNAQRELRSIAGRNMSENAKWFTTLGSPPLRTVLQTALGLPAGFATVDLDRQLGILKDQAGRALGSSDIAQFKDPARVDKLVRLFLLRSQSQSPGTVETAALTLLQQARNPSGALSRYV